MDRISFWTVTLKQQSQLTLKVSRTRDNKIRSKPHHPGNSGVFHSFTGGLNNTRGNPREKYSALPTTFFKSSSLK